MKFCKKYEEYMQGQEKKNLPGVGFKNLKKILKKCRRGFSARKNLNHHDNCPRECPVCDGTFFPALMKEMENVVGWFNEHAQKLLELHLASGFKKYLSWFKGNRPRNHLALIQEGKDLVSYALINAVAIRKILKKYDKIHESKQGQAFKTQVQKMHIEILQSPWLCELMAFHINLRETQKKSVAESVHSSLFGGCSLMFNDGKPLLSCSLFDSMKVDIDLTCSICLVRSLTRIFLLDDKKKKLSANWMQSSICALPLSCGHIFCYMCACSAASVSIIDGLKAAEPTEKCPLCREVHVYEGAVHMDELNILLRRSCHEYWKERRRTERAERLQQAKEYWDFQCKTFVGI